MLFIIENFYDGYAAAGIPAGMEDADPLRRILSGSCPSPADIMKTGIRSGDIEENEQIILKNEKENKNENKLKEEKEIKEIKEIINNDMKNKEEKNNIN